VPGVGHVHLRVASRSRPHGRRSLSFRRNCQPAKLWGGPEKASALCRPRFLLRAFLKIQSRFEMIAHRLPNVRRLDTAQHTKHSQETPSVG
jgi:hypothetical protein